MGGRESLFPFLRQTMESTQATLRGLQREVEHHTDLTPEIDALTEGITRLDAEADRGSLIPGWTGTALLERDFLGSNPHVVAGQRWESLDRRDDGLRATVISTSGPGGYVTIRRIRKSRVRYERFVKSYRLVEA